MRKTDQNTDKNHCSTQRPRGQYKIKVAVTDNLGSSFAEREVLFSIG